MELAALLEGARTAPPSRRIELRDQIAAYGVPAIEGVRPWLDDDRLAAFAVRVIEQVGIEGEPAQATRVLRSERGRVPANVTGDVDWALQRLKAARRPAQQPASPATPVVASQRREPARYDSVTRRRPR